MPVQRLDLRSCGLARALQARPRAQPMWSGHDVAGAVTFRAAFVAAMAAVAVAVAAPAAGARADEVKPANLGAVMDSVFGAGKWRETGGYRTPARENELPAQGALTVPVGLLSHHSSGRPG